MSTLFVCLFHTKSISHVLRDFYPSLLAEKVVITNKNIILTSEKGTVCEAPVGWSKYTTVGVQVWVAV